MIDLNHLPSFFHLSQFNIVVSYFDSIKYYSIVFVILQKRDFVYISSFFYIM